MKGLAALTVIAAVQTHAAGVPAQQPKPSINPVPLEIPFASPNAAGVTVESAPSAWGGARSGSEPTLSDRVVDYKINATLDPVAHTVSGQEKLTWRNRSDRPIRVIYLHLYLNALESQGSTFLTEEQRRGRDQRGLLVSTILFLSALLGDFFINWLANQVRNPWTSLLRYWPVLVGLTLVVLVAFATRRFVTERARVRGDDGGPGPDTAFPPVTSLVGQEDTVREVAALDRGPEAITGCRRGNNRNRRLGVAPEKRLQEIRLLGFCRQSRGWSAALDIADDQRNFHGHRETQRFCF